MVRGVLRVVLMTSGHDVFMTATGGEAVELASRMRAMLVLLDLNMPKLNGLLACERLRALPGYADTPIVMLTAYDNLAARCASARVGATLFIAKPFRPAGLLAALAPYLATKRPGSLLEQRRPQADPGRTATPTRGHALDRGKSVLDVCRGEVLDAAVKLSGSPPSAGQG